MKTVVTIKYILCVLLLSSCLKNQDEEVDFIQSTSVPLPEMYSGLENVQAYPIQDTFPYNISLIKVQEYADSDHFFLPHINHFAVGDSGLLFIANRRKIEVFDSEGVHIKTLGGYGRGPGEFSNMAMLSPKVMSNRVYAYDDVLRRVNIFSMDSLSFSHTFKIPSRDVTNVSDTSITKLRDIYMVNDSLLLMGLSKLTREAEKGGYRRYDLFDLQGNIISENVLSYNEHPANSFYVFEMGQTLPLTLLNVPTNSYFKIAFDSHQNIYTTKGDDFLIKIYDSDGTYSHAVYYPYKNIPVERESIIEANSYNPAREKRIKEYEFPEVWPAIHQLFVDDEGRLWVATIIDDEEHFEWWVLDDEGRLMTKFVLPGERMRRNTSTRDSSIPVVKDGHFYTTERDTTTDINKIVKYKIVLEKGDQ